MSAEQIVDRFKKTYKRDVEMAFKELQENIMNFGKDKAVTILMLSGKKHCDAGYLVKQHKDA